MHRLTPMARRRLGLTLGPLALSAGFGLLRLGELLFSRQHIAQQRRRGARVVKEPLYAAMVALHVGVLVAAPIEAALRRRASPRPMRAVALGALGLAALLRYAALASLGEAWNVRVLHFTKRRVPIVTIGPYRYLRHPNYLAVIVELAALPLASGALLTAAAGTIANALLLAHRIPLEERELFSDPRYRAIMGPRPRLWPR